MEYLDVFLMFIQVFSCFECKIKQIKYLDFISSQICELNVVINK